MTILEKKVDALMRFVSATNDFDRCDAMGDIKLLLNNDKLMDASEMIRNETEAILMEIGVPCHLSGFRYLITGVQLMIEDPTIAQSITKRLYPEIATREGRSGRLVERNMRNAIEVATNNGDPEIMQHYFGNTILASKGKATNTQFIVTLAREVKRRVYGL